MVTATTVSPTRKSDQGGAKGVEMGIMLTLKEGCERGATGVQQGVQQGITLKRGPKGVQKGYFCVGKSGLGLALWA
jgi:hypothetical protein